MFTEHVGNLQAAQSLEELKQVLEQVLGDCEAALTHEGTLRIDGALPAGAKDDAVLYVKNGYIAPNDATTEPDAEGNLPNGWAGIFDGGLRVKGQFKADQGVGITFEQLLDLFPIGFQMPWYSTSNIPSGWAIMDGTSNAAGSGIDRGGKVGYGYISGDPTFGTLGDPVDIALATSFSGGSAVNTGDAGSHAHTVATSEITSKVGVNDHASHTHEVTFTGSQVAATLANHTSGGTSGGGAGTDDVAYGTISAHATSGTSMTSDSAVPSPTLTHTVTCSSSLDTNTVSDHTHTVATTAIAAQLTIGTPSTVRPPGVVELWIEKIS